MSTNTLKTNVLEYDYFRMYSSTSTLECLMITLNVVMITLMITLMNILFLTFRRFSWKSQIQ